MSNPARRVSRRLPPLPGHSYHSNHQPSLSPTARAAPTMHSFVTQLTDEQVRDYVTAHPAFLDDYVNDHVSRERVEDWLLRKRCPVTGADGAQTAALLQRAPSLQTRYLDDDVIDLQKYIVGHTAAREDHLPTWYELLNVIGLAVRADVSHLYVLTDRGESLSLYTPGETEEAYSLQPGGPVRPSTTVAAHVAGCGRGIMTSDLSDARWPQGAGPAPADPLLHSVVTLPVCLPSEDLLGVMQLGRHCRAPTFTENEFHTANAMVGWMGAFIYETGVCRSAVKQAELNDFLLGVSTELFADIVQLDMLIEKIMGYAKDLVQAERCSLFLNDKTRGELYSNMFDMGEVANGKPLFEKKEEIRFPVTKGIAGHVARTKEVINIRDAYSDPRFNRDIDKQTGFTTRNLLCMPVMADSGVVGVVQMVNKRKGDGFTNADVSSFKMFAVYCAIALYYSKMLDSLRLEKARYKVAIEQMAYHLKAPDEYVQHHHTINVDELPADIDSYLFYGPQEHEAELPDMWVSMMGRLFGEGAFDTTRLLRFALTVRKNYRPVSYHNWQHGWNVAHCMYAMLRRLAERPGGSPIAGLHQRALMVAALSHDVDHRGYNNSYYSKFMEPLATLYPSSVLERHHYSHLVTILQQDGHDIFSDLHPDEYKQVLEYMQHAIIATDLALYFPRQKKMKALIDSGQYDINTNKEHLSDVIALMMTGSDLCAVCKPWSVQRVAVDYLYQEFYLQGDIERNNGFQPIPMMDRHQAASVPKDQVGFIQFVCLPLYSTLAAVIPEARGLAENTERNLQNWKRIVEGKEVSEDVDSAPDKTAEVKVNGEDVTSEPEVSNTADEKTETVVDNGSKDSKDKEDNCNCNDCRAKDAKDQSAAPVNTVHTQNTVTINGKPEPQPAISTKQKEVEV